MKKGLKAIFILLIAFHFGVTVAQDFKFDATFDSTKILIGDQVKFHIYLEQPKGATVKVPVFTDRLQDKIEVIKVFLPDTQKMDNRLKITFDYLITCFDSGEYKIDSIVAPYEFGQLKDTIRATQAMLIVVPVLTDTITQVKDIKPPLNTPISFAEIWPYIAGGLLLLAIIIVAIYFIRQRKTGGNILSGFKKIDPPHLVALQQLDKLRAEKLWQNNLTKQYYVRLSEIARKYIEDRFEVEALEMTTDETISALNRILINDTSLVDQLRNLLTLADLVKFAKANPLPDENEVSMLNAYQFVNNTIPVNAGPIMEESAGSNDENDNQQVLNK